jgi:DNA repair protein RadC
MPSKRQRLIQLQGDWTAAEISISFKPGVKWTTKITSDREAYDMLLSVWNPGLLALQEQFVVVFLNNRQQVIGWRVLNIGSMETCVIDIRLLLASPSIAWPHLLFSRITILRGYLKPA